MAIPTAPTGLTVQTFRNKLEIRWIANPDSDKVQGYNIYNSTTSGGGISGYVKLNTTLIEVPSEVDKEQMSSTEVVNEASTGPDQTQQTTTTVINFQEVNVFLYVHDNLTVASTQYYVVTAVNDTGNESAQSIEVSGTPIIISTAIVPTQIRSQNDISLDYITTLLTREPKLDVKPGSVTRQLHVDPNSLEMYLMNVRNDFTNQSQSFLTLRNLDDSNGDGISDPVSDSPYKQLLEVAFFFTSDTADTDVQNMIDFAFDKLAFNFGTFRIAATQAQTILTFYTETPITADVTVNSGAIISTVPTANEAAITFSTLTSGTMTVAGLQGFFNASTQRYELKIPAQAVAAGSAGNVSSDTLISSSVSGLQVTNTATAFGGQDSESNSSLADRAELAIVGVDIGTFYGYKKNVAGIPTVEDEKIVDAGDYLMQRDYDEVRHKHIYGKVDIYIDGGLPIQYQDSFGFLFALINNDTNFNRNILPFNGSTNVLIECTNSSVSSSSQIISVKNILNVTKNEEYDISGCWTLYLNSIAMDKSLVRVTLLTGQILFLNPLTAGDQVIADYFYRTSILNESPISFDNINFTLLHEPVENSYTVYKNTTGQAAKILVEGTDYTIDILTRVITLIITLGINDTITVDYDYIIPVVGEVVVASATSEQTTAAFANPDILQSCILEFQYQQCIFINTKNNLTNMTIGTGNNDKFSVNYRYQNPDNAYLFLNQPVDSISSVSNESGTLNPAEYRLNKFDDILLNGNSTKANRTLTMIPPFSISGDSIHYTSENIVLINFEMTSLSNKGIDIDTIILKEQNPSTTVYSAGHDYIVTAEDGGYNVRISRTTISTIPDDGRSLSCSYEYAELYTVTYNVNPLIAIVQNVINSGRPLAADVLIKGAIETSLDFEIGIIAKANSDLNLLSANCKSAISNQINRLKLGQGIAQSDIVSALESVNNVVSVMIPLTKIVKSNGDQINREELTAEFQLYQQNVVRAWTTGINALQNKTKGSNGNDGFYAIFEDDRPLTMISDPTQVDAAAGQGYISNQGEVIISTLNGGIDPTDDPSKHIYTVDYAVFGNIGSSDISITSLEYLTVGNIILNLVPQTILSTTN